MPLSAGDKLGPYEIVAPLGAGGFSVYQKASNLAGQEELLYQPPEIKGSPNWTHDGKLLVYTALSSEGKGSDLWVLPAAGAAAHRPVLSRWAMGCVCVEPVR